MVGRSLILSVLGFIGVWFGVAALVGHVLAGTHWLAGLIAGVLTAITAFYFFLPLAGLIAAQFTETTIRAVERRHYPDLPPPAHATLAWQLAEGARLALRILLCTAAGFIVSLLLPGFGLLIGVAAAGYGLGPGLFMLVATRRLDRAAARAALAENRGPVLVQGIALAMIGFVPMLNLLLPILGLAMMVHLLDGAMLAGPKQGF